MPLYHLTWRGIRRANARAAAIRRGLDLLAASALIVASLLIGGLAR